MAQEWIAPIITGLVGVAGIAGTGFAAYVQRRAQVEVTTAQQTYETRVRREADKREAYERFLDAHDSLHSRVVQLLDEASPSADQEREQSRAQLQELRRELDAARNRLALYAGLSLIYYLDQLMADAHGEAEAAEHGRPQDRRHPAAVHKVYWLMRQELENPDITERSQVQVLDALRDHEQRSREILKLLEEADFQDRET